MPRRSTTKPSTTHAALGPPTFALCGRTDPMGLRFSTSQSGSRNRHGADRSRSDEDRLFERLQCEEQTRCIPVIVLTNSCDGVAFAQARSRGAVTVLPKFGCRFVAPLGKGSLRGSGRVALLGVEPLLGRSPSRPPELRRIWAVCAAHVKRCGISSRI